MLSVVALPPRSPRAPQPLTADSMFDSPRGVHPDMTKAVSLPMRSPSFVARSPIPPSGALGSPRVAASPLITSRTMLTLYGSGFDPAAPSMSRPPTLQRMPSDLIQTTPAAVDRLFGHVRQTVAAYSTGAVTTTGEPPAPSPLSVSRVIPMLDASQRADSLKAMLPQPPSRQASSSSINSVTPRAAWTSDSEHFRNLQEQPRTGIQKPPHFVTTGSSSQSADHVVSPSLRSAALNDDDNGINSQESESDYDSFESESDDDYSSSEKASSVSSKVKSAVAAALSDIIDSPKVTIVRRTSSRMSKNSYGSSREESKEHPSKKERTKQPTQCCLLQ